MLPRKLHDELSQTHSRPSGGADDPQLPTALCWKANEPTPQQKRSYVWGQLAMYLFLFLVPTGLTLFNAGYVPVLLVLIICAVLLFAVRYLLNISGSERPAYPRQLLWIYLAFVVFMNNGFFVWLPFVLFPVLTLMLARQFRAHTIYVASAMPLPKSVAELFRRHLKLPAGTKKGSLLRGYVQALKDWFFYGLATDERRSGVLMTPAGSHRSRENLTTVLLLTWCLIAATACLGSHSFGSPSMWFNDLEPANKESNPLYSISGFVVNFVLLTVLFWPGLFPIVFIGVTFFASATALRKCDGLRQQQQASENWVELCESLEEEAKRIGVKELLFLGIADDGTPILKQPRKGTPHYLNQGASGSGKSSYASSLKNQFIRMGYNVLDISFDNGLQNYWTLHHALEQHEIKDAKLSFLTNVIGYPTHLLHFASQEALRRISNPQFIDALMNVSGFTNSREHGESYFTDFAYAILRGALNAAPMRPESIESLKKEHNLFMGTGAKALGAKTADGAHIGFDIDRLSDVACLRMDESYPKKAIENAIDMADLFLKERQYVVCSLPALAGNRQAADIGRFVLAMFVAAASAFGSTKSKTLLVIDEFAELAAPGLLSTVIEGIRHAGVDVMLSVQTAAAIERGGEHLRSSIEQNTGTKTFFRTIGDEQITSLSKNSGQRLVHLQSYSRTVNSDFGSSETSTNTETLYPRLSVNDIGRINGAPQSFVLWPTDDDKFLNNRGMPFECRQVFHIPQDKFEELNNRGAPEQQEDMIIVPKDVRKKDEGTTEAATVPNIAEAMAEQFPNFGFSPPPWRTN